MDCSDYPELSGRHLFHSHDSIQRVLESAEGKKVTEVAITVPSIRERKEDLPPLIGHFLRSFAVENKKEIQGINPKAKDLLLKYDYPGNVREPDNIIERAVVITCGSII